MSARIDVAEPKDRFLAAAIDFVPPFVLVLFFTVLGSPGLSTAAAVLGSIYLAGRDALFQGQSLGKRYRNLQVVDSDTDRIPDPMALVLRNLGFLIPGLNIIYAIVEGIQVIRHPQGQRFGDLFAETGVVTVSKEEREKLLAPPVERKSRDSIPRFDAPAPVLGPDGKPVADFDPTAATTPGESSIPKPAPKSGAMPGFGGPAKKPSMDLPAEDPKKAPPAAPATPAKRVPAAGVQMSDEDPLKKLVDKAGGGAKPT